MLDVVKLMKTHEEYHITIVGRLDHFTGHEICVRLLLDNGADVDAVQDGGNTPLLLAAARGHDAVMRLLIDRGADIRVRNRRDKDAVFMAVVYGHAAKGLPWVLQVQRLSRITSNPLDCFFKKLLC